MKAAETLATKRVVEALIQNRAIALSIRRHTLVPDGAGGRTHSPSVLGAQKFCMTQIVEEQRIAGDGAVINRHGTLLGYHDADLQIGDEFDYQGLTYRVLTINADRSYRTYAEVAVRGS